MKPPPPDPVDDALRAWQPEVPRDPALTRHVLNQIALETGRAEARSTGPTPRLLASFAVPLAAACVVLALALFWQTPVSTEADLATLERYRLAIDPLARLEVAPRAPTALEVEPSLVQMLRWMQERLELSEAQFLALAALDTRYSPEFERLYHTLVQSEEAFGRFEALRFETDRIDFVALYEVIKERQRTEKTAAETSAGFVQAVLQVLDPAQQARYLALLSNPLPEADA